MLAATAVLISRTCHAEKWKVDFCCFFSFLPLHLLFIILKEIGIMFNLFYYTTEDRIIVCLEMQPCPTQYHLGEFPSHLGFDQMLLIARDQSVLNMKITWKSVSSSFPEGSESAFLLSKSFSSSLGYIPSLWYILDLQGMCKGWILYAF